MINIPKGTKDVLPQDAYKWHFIEDAARQTAAEFNLKEIRTPVFEHTELFLRGVGDTTDIVNKEMYTFKDKGDRSITLKPEGTAGVARSFLENGMSSGVLPAKMYYIIPAFRYERPQAGRLREFHQFGIEVYGSDKPDADAEVIFAASSFLNKLGVKNVKLNINSIGCKKCRADYNAALKGYLAPHIGEMCATCRERYEKNPLRILDCKEEECKKITAGAPRMTDYLCSDCAQHFNEVQSNLAAGGLEYEVDPNIVRGLDYYTRTVFEFVSQEIGAQGTVCGGGRYDGLIEELGGSHTPAVGFAAGIERLILLMENTGVPFPEESKPEVYFAGMDEESRKKAFALAMAARAQGIAAETDHMGRSVKAQFKYADKIGAKYVAAIGGNELAEGAVNVKRMADGFVQNVRFEDINGYIVQNRS
ncbi:MAG: histidine--tRNA ligase [Clostridia bacterium]|nr:histidine--tRNA ligase [Clostridia bacterium]